CARDSDYYGTGYFDIIPPDYGRFDVW
nr:immunoglobulin heavy chain junction region [Macaca mulatta]MOV40080.1 immunoglobulin heavy chain junction region [Macaca mulatta]MOV44205.1 immunoglobulin heavy chain junction region [Macaca mulatta]MOV47306.1 immunoglobulin heavy chain junction region [Macaca mulatta]